MTIFLWPIFADTAVGDNHLGRYDKLRVEEIARELKIKAIRLSPHFQNTLETFRVALPVSSTPLEMGCTPTSWVQNLGEEFIAKELGVFSQQKTL